MVERSVLAFTVIELFGAGYVVWLGVQAIRHRRELSRVLEAAEVIRPRRSLFIDGMVVGVANPKAIVFFVAILPQFVEPDGAPAGVQMALLGVVFILIALVSDGAWGLAAGTARHWFARSPHRLERLGGAGGLVIDRTRHPARGLRPQAVTNATRRRGARPRSRSSHP